MNKITTLGIDLAKSVFLRIPVDHDRAFRFNVTADSDLA